MNKNKKSNNIVETAVPRLVSVEELAAAWSVQPSTVREWARSQALPAIKVGKCWRFAVEDLQRVVREGRR